MRADNLTIAEAFKANGYETGHFGKWHLGDAWPMRPQDQGLMRWLVLAAEQLVEIADYWGNDYFDDTYYHNGIPKSMKVTVRMFLMKRRATLKESKTSHSLSILHRM